MVSIAARGRPATSEKPPPRGAEAYPQLEKRPDFDLRASLPDMVEGPGDLRVGMGGVDIRGKLVFRTRVLLPRWNLACYWYRVLGWILPKYRTERYRRRIVGETASVEN